MGQILSGGLRMLLILTLLTGMAYPLSVTALAQTLFSRQANGTLLEHAGQVVGSAWIGQNFSDPKYFHGRSSAAGADGYDANASAGSNLGPTSKNLLEKIEGRARQVREENGDSAGTPVPVDLVTASASGLDPHISLAGAEYQVERVAKARGVAPMEVRKLVSQHTEQRQLGVLGEPRVHVLKLNLALEELALVR